MEGRGHRAGIAEEVHDHRGRPEGEYAGAGALRVAVDVDQNIDLVLGDLPGGSCVVERCYVAPVIHRGLVTLLDRVVLPGLPAVIGEEFDPAFVVQLEHLTESKTDDMLPEVGRQVPDAKALSRSGSCPHRSRLELFRRQAAHKSLLIPVCLGQLEQRVVDKTGERHRGYAVK